MFMGNIWLNHPKNKTTMTKVEALEQTIYNLENDVYEYSWSTLDTCNCGVLARTLLGGKLPTNAGFYKSPKYGGKGVFAKQAFCVTTNLPLPEVFKVLKEAGFTYPELLELEYLGNKKIAQRLGWLLSEIGGVYFIDGFDAKNRLIAYLKAWVSILKEEQKPEVLQPTPQIIERIKYVSVPESITEQTKTLILQ